MSRLLVLNGPPGVGKTTVARRYADDHPLALCLDIDSVRRMLGRWREDANRAGLLARSLTTCMAREHLTQGYDVVLPQYLGNPAFLQQAEAVAHETGAVFSEFVLMDGRDEVVRRFNDRTRRAAEPGHLDAAEIVAGLGGDDLLFTMYDRLLLLLNARPHARVLQCPEGAVEQVYRQMVEALG